MFHGRSGRVASLISSLSINRFVNQSPIQKTLVSNNPSEYKNKRERPWDQPRSERPASQGPPSGWRRAIGAAAKDKEPTPCAIRARSRSARAVGSVDLLSKIIYVSTLTVNRNRWSRIFLCIRDPPQIQWLCYHSCLRPLTGRGPPAQQS